MHTDEFQPRQQLQRGHRLGRGTRGHRKAELGVLPPVRMNSCVWASTPGVTRTNTHGAVRSSRRRIEEAAEPGYLVERVDDDTAHAASPERRAILPPTCCFRAGPASQGAPRPTGPRGAHLLMPHRDACPLRRPAGPWPGRGMPWRRTPPPPPMPRRRPGRPGGDETRRRRRAGCRTRMRGRAGRYPPPGGGPRGRRWPSAAAAPLHRSTGQLLVHGHGNAGYGSRRPGRDAIVGEQSTLFPCSCPRSSADRAPASGAGGAGSSPAGGAFGGSSDSGGLRFPRATQRRS